MLCTFGAACLLCLAWHTRAVGAVGAVSASGQTNIAGPGGSYGPAFSTDGRFVAFVSHAKNLATNDVFSPYLDVYVRDLARRNTLLASVNNTGIGGGNGDAYAPSISSNGQFVAFASMASNLVNNDTNGASDIFVRDMLSGATTLVSVDVTGISSAGIFSPWTRNRLSGNPLISGDGHWVIFESLATNLVALADTNQATDVFARDLLSNTTLLVSVNAAGTASGSGNSELGDITPDGRFVAFVSTSTDLVPGVANRLGDIYVRDLQSGSTFWASTNMYPIIFATTGYRCFNPVLSADGRFVAFKMIFPDRPVCVIHHDLQSGANLVLAVNTAIASTPQISADGRFVASEDSIAQNIPHSDVYVWDVATHSNLLVSVNLSGTGGGNQPSHTPVMTPDGRSVAFLSAATDLVTNATNGASQVYIRDIAGATTRLISVSLDGMASSGAIDITVPTISSDGQLIAFESTASDLVAADLNQASDIFLRDIAAGATQLVSQRHPALPEGTGATLSTAFAKSISADGHIVIFASLDSNLVADDEDEVRDLFVCTVPKANLARVSAGTGPGPFNAAQARVGIEPAISSDGAFAAFRTLIPDLFAMQITGSILRYDMQAHSNEIVSLRSDGTGPASSLSSAPVISSDGTLVAFQSDARDLVSGISVDHTNVYVRDMRLQTNKLVSISLLGNTSGNGDSFSPLFSPDDRWIVFASTALNLTTNNLDGAQYLFARDLISNTTRLISARPSSSRYAHGAVFSADSRHLAFVGTNNVVAVYDFLRATSVLACAGCDNPSLSADGRLVAYETTNFPSAANDIVVKDLQTGATNLISRNRLGTGGGNGSSTSPLLSWDGRFVVFASKASDLVDNDNNNASDIFVCDRLLGTTMLASLNLQGVGSGNGPSTKPVLAADGRTVVFQSFASDLVPGDYNYRRDVFVLRLGGADSDGDGMDDDWEMAYFGTLARDGSGDFDGDGQTDLQEFLAGTDPTNTGSVLRVLALNLLGNGATKLIWSSAPGKTYRVQFKDSIDAADWSYLPGAVIASGTTATLVDDTPTAGGQRFYRAILIP